MAGPIVVGGRSPAGELSLVAGELFCADEQGRRFGVTVRFHRKYGPLDRAKLGSRRGSAGPKRQLDVQFAPSPRGAGMMTRGDPSGLPLPGLGSGNL